MEQLQMSTRLRDQHGGRLTMYDEQDEPLVFDILSEFKWGQHEYAVLQTKELKKEGEVAIFRVVTDQQGQVTIETIEDDDEWEAVSELYDEIVFDEASKKGD
jgi:uncharacterized protein YrzB (UPF0473 family)